MTNVRIEVGDREFHVKLTFTADDTWYAEGFARLNAVDIIDGSATFKVTYLQHENWFAVAKDLNQAMSGLRQSIQQFELDFDNCVAEDGAL